MTSYCPACGGEGTLRAVTQPVGVLVRCSRADCPDPESVMKILADPEVGHVAVFADGYLTVKHPLTERIDDAILSCSIHDDIEHLGDRGLEGTFRVRREDDLTLALEPVE